MTMDPYVGSAGGQPRVTFPFMSLNPDDPRFQQKFEANMRTLYTWANSLLLGGSSSGRMLAWAKYTSTIGDNTTKNPVVWTLTTGSGFGYFDGSIETIVAFPPDSLNLLLYGSSFGPTIPSGADNKMTLQIFDGSSTVVEDLVSAYRYEDAASGTPQDFWFSPNGWTLYDVDNLPSALPYHFVGQVQDLGSVGFYLSIMSWEKPT